MARPWSVICEVVDTKTGGKVVHGLGVILTDGEEKRETARVAFDRDASKHPEVPFTDVLRGEIEKAEEAADAINDLLDTFDRQQLEFRMAAKDKITEALGKAPAWNSKPL